jgi:hypothetical protein
MLLRKSPMTPAHLEANRKAVRPSIIADRSRGKHC